MKRAVPKKRARVERCANCSAPDPAPGHTVCARCLERMRKGQAERRKRWRSAGLCIYCGRKRQGQFASCARCLARKRMSRKAR